MRAEDEEEGREGIAKAIDDAAKAVAAIAEFRLVCDRIRAAQEQRAQQGQESLSFVEQVAEYLSQAKADPKAGPPIPPPPLAPAPPNMPFSPPLKAAPVPLPPVPPKPKPPMVNAQIPFKQLPLPPPFSPPLPSPEPQTEPGLPSGSELEPADSSSSTSSEKKQK